MWVLDFSHGQDGVVDLDDEQEGLVDGEVDVGAEVVVADLLVGILSQVVDRILAPRPKSFIEDTPSVG